MNVIGRLALVGVACLMVSCVDVYPGTRIECNISILEGQGYRHQDMVLPTPGARPGDPNYFSHYELHADIAGAGTIRLLSFIVQPAVLSHHPCLQFEPERYCIDAEGPDGKCDDYINMERFAPLEELFVAVSVAPTVDDGATYIHQPGYDLMDREMFPDELFVDPELTDPAEKLDRENLDQDAVEAFCDDLSPDYYLADVNQLTSPKNGDLHGVINGSDPRTGVTVGGITFFTLAALEDMSALYLVRERDASRLSPENINENLAPSADSQVFMMGREDGSIGYIRYGEYRGVMTIRLESPLGLPVFLVGTVYYDIDEDPLNF